MSSSIPPSLVASYMTLKDYKIAEANLITFHFGKFLFVYKISVYYICSCLEDYLFSDENILGGVEGGLIKVRLPI